MYREEEVTFSNQKGLCVTRAGSMWCPRIKLPNAGEKRGSSRPRLYGGLSSDTGGAVSVDRV